MNIEDKSIPLTLREQSEEWYDKEANMCEKLDAMREFGNKAARALCGHLDDMGAAKATIPIKQIGRHYVVTVERLHASDCATHNMPAYPNGECDCGYSDRTPCADPACEISTATANKP